MCTPRVPRFSVFAVFILLAFPRINNLRVFNATNSSIPTAPTKVLFENKELAEMPKMIHCCILVQSVRVLSYLLLS